MSKHRQNYRPLRRTHNGLIAMCMTGLVVIGAMLLAPQINSAEATTGEAFTVTKSGITLNGSTFEDNGHVNVRLTDGTTYNAHFEGKCKTRTDAECAGLPHALAQYIGTSYMPWSVLGIDGEDCIEWVQKSGVNYHFGEHGEEPVCCKGQPSEEPSPTEPTSPSPTEPTPTEPTPSEPTSPPPTEPTEPSPTVPTDEPTTPAPTTPTEYPEPTTPTEQPTKPPGEGSAQQIECIDGVFVTTVNGHVTSTSGSCDETVPVEEPEAYEEGA